MSNTDTNTNTIKRERSRPLGKTEKHDVLTINILEVLKNHILVLDYDYMVGNTCTRSNTFSSQRCPAKKAGQCHICHHHHRVRKSKNFPDSNIFHAKTFQIKRVNRDTFDFPTKVRITGEFHVFLPNVHKDGLDGVWVIR